MIKYIEEIDIYVDENGGVYKKKKNGELKPCYQKNSNGYKQITIFKGWEHKSYMVHRLVAMAFIPNPENKPYVDHINRIKDDNRVENLRWVTPKENMLNRSNNIVEMKEWLKTHSSSEDVNEYYRMRYKLKKNNEEQNHCA